MTGGFFALGWVLHFIPFFIMGRALFLHHYLPALIFSILTVANLVDFIVRYEKPWIQNLVVLVMTVIYAGTFFCKSPVFLVVRLNMP
jgi:dolichyl-phosphate-mannose-protein mannosyltransferase